MKHSKHKQKGISFAEEGTQKCIKPFKQTICTTPKLHVILPPSRLNPAASLRGGSRARGSPRIKSIHKNGNKCNIRSYTVTLQKHRATHTRTRNIARKENIPFCLNIAIYIHRRLKGGDRRIPKSGASPPARDTKYRLCPSRPLSNCILR